MLGDHVCVVCEYFESLVILDSGVILLAMHLHPGVKHTLHHHWNTMYMYMYTMKNNV